MSPTPFGTWEEFRVDGSTGSRKSNSTYAEGLRNKSGFKEIELSKRYEGEGNGPDSGTSVFPEKAKKQISHQKAPPQKQSSDSDKRKYLCDEIFVGSLLPH